jgi:hypothetical protein
MKGDGEMSLTSFLQKPFLSASKLTFYGDGHPYLYEPVMWFPKQHIVCDYSECGLWVSSGWFEIGEECIRTWLKEVLKNYSPETEVHAEANCKANFFRRNNIKTVKDLIRVLEEEDKNAKNTT